MENLAPNMYKTFKMLNNIAVSFNNPVNLCASNTHDHIHHL